MPAVLADVGSVPIIDERVADAFAAPADDLEPYHYAWAGGRGGRWPNITHPNAIREMENHGWGGDVLAARRRHEDRGRELAAGGKGEAMTVQDGLDIQVPQPALLFDLDGTLVDSVYQHVIAWQEALATCGIELSVWRIHRLIGMSGGLFIDALSRETGVRLDEELSQRLRELHAQAYLRRRPDRGPAARGPRELPRTCTSVRCRSRSRPAGPETHRGLRAGAAGPARRRARRDPRLGGAGQARPAPVPRCGLRLGVDPAHCFVVGDSVWDLLAAQRAGALGIGVLSGGYGREELERRGRLPRLRRPGRDADPAGGGRRSAYPLTVDSDRGGCVAGAARVDHDCVRVRWETEAPPERSRRNA